MRNISSPNARLLTALSLATILTACGGGGSAPPPPTPALSQLAPASSLAGCGKVSLTATGSNFQPSSVLLWNGSALPTTYVSATQLTAQIPAASLATAGTDNLTVSTTGAASVSNALPFVATQGTTTHAVGFQIDPGHTGTASVACGVTLPAASAWSADLGGTPTYALIAEGKVFVTAQAGTVSKLFALDQATGKIVWGPIILPAGTNAAYDAGQVFVMNGGFDSGLMRAFNAANGTLNWSATLPGQYAFSSAPSAANGMVYTGAAGSGGTLYGFNQASGALTWTASVANGDDSTPALTPYGVFVTYPCQVYAVKPADGHYLWTNSTGCDGGGGGTPVVANDVLYAPNGVGSYGGMTFNAQTGALIGSFTADNLPSIATQAGYFLQGGTLRGISLANNQELWSFAGDGQLTTSPITVNQYTFIGSRSGHLFAVDNRTGHQAWDVDVGNPFPNGAGWGAGIPLTGLSAGDGLLVVPSGNTIIAYSLVAGSN